MKNKLSVISISLFMIIAILVSCAEPKTSVPAIDPVNLDKSVVPGNDFDSYANGGWKNLNPLPADRGRFGTFDKLAEDAEKQVNDLVKTTAAGNNPKGSVPDKIATLFNSGMDSAKIEKQGNLTDWWTPEDSKRFEERTKILVDQYNSFVVLDTIHANGQLSLGENIADLGGLNISYQAFMKANTQKNPINEFTPAQRFFLAYAHIWGQNTRDKEILRRTKEDVHSLGRFRILGPL